MEQIKFGKVFISDFSSDYKSKNQNPIVELVLLSLTQPLKLQRLINFATANEFSIQFCFLYVIVAFVSDLFLFHLIQQKEVDLQVVAFKPSAYDFFFFFVIRLPLKLKFIFVAFYAS